MFHSRVILAFQISYRLALMVWRCQVTMPKASKLSEFEHGRIFELHKQGLSQRAIAAE